MFKRKIKRSDWMQGLLDCEDSVKSNPDQSIESRKQGIYACAELDLMFPEYIQHTSSKYRGMLDYLIYYEKVILTK